MIGFSCNNKLTELDWLLETKVVFSSTTGEILTALAICKRMIMLVYSPHRDFSKD